MFIPKHSFSLYFVILTALFEAKRHGRFQLVCYASNRSRIQYFIFPEINKEPTNSSLISPYAICHPDGSCFVLPGEICRHGLRKKRESKLLNFLLRLIIPCHPPIPTSFFKKIKKFSLTTVVIFSFLLLSALKAQTPVHIASSLSTGPQLPSNLIDTNFYPVSESYGLGVPIFDGKHILTCAHVIYQGGTITVISGDQQQPAILLSINKKYDLALLRVAQPFKPFLIASVSPQSQETLFFWDKSLIRHSASYNIDNTLSFALPLGSSGSAVVNKNNQLIGIISQSNNTTSLLVSDLITKIANLIPSKDQNQLEATKVY